MEKLFAYIQLPIGNILAMYHTICMRDYAWLTNDFIVLIDT